MYDVVFEQVRITNNELRRIINSNLEIGILERKRKQSINNIIFTWWKKKFKKLNNSFLKNYSSFERMKIYQRYYADFSKNHSIVGDVKFLK